MQATMLNIRKFYFNRSQSRSLNGDSLLYNTQFLVESFTIHIVFSVSAACVLLVLVRSRSHWVKRASPVFSPRRGKKSLGRRFNE
jgi:hypothetical protein